MILSFLTCVIRFMKIIMKSAGGHFQLMWYIMLFVCQFNVLFILDSKGVDMVKIEQLRLV